jgi:tetraacyldisaccharide 4'-kinase
VSATAGWPVVAARGRWLEDLPTSPWRWLAAPAWLAYRPLIGLRNSLYDARLLKARSLPVPVVSIGNLAAGGTGKTPATLLLARIWRELGAKPVVLSRGYKGDASGNEEARLMDDVPVVCDPDRLRGGLRAIADHAADAILLDDGFQHRRLARDRDVVLIDATDPWGGGAVLPLGRLRESRAALARAHLLLVTRADLVGDAVREALLAELARFAKPIVRADQGEATIAPLHGGAARPPGELGAPALLASGIGNPRAFELTAARAFGRPAAAYRFPDHHHFVLGDVSLVRAAAERLSARIVVTAKDAVKLAPLVPREEAGRWWVLASEPRIDHGGMEALRNLLKDVTPMRRPSSALSPVQR